MPVTIGTNAYLGQSEADAYFASRLHSTGWTAATADDRGLALIAGTAAVDRLGFSGMIAGYDQRLAWPRIRMRDREGRVIAADAVPDAVKAATCEYALHLLTTPEAAKPAPAVSEKRVGDLQISYRATSPDTVPVMVRKLLSPFLSGTPHSVGVIL